jgi:arsenate reductase
MYLYDKCDSCRKARRFLEGRQVPVEVRDIVAQPPGRVELLRALQAVGGNVRRLFNTSGKQYRELRLGEKVATMSDEEALALLETNGWFVKRPLLLWEGGALVGYSEDRWKEAASSAGWGAAS